MRWLHAGSSQCVSSHLPGLVQKALGAHSSIKTSASVYKAALRGQSPAGIKGIPGKRAHPNSAFGESRAMFNPCGKCFRERQFHLCSLNSSFHDQAALSKTQNLCRSQSKLKGLLQDQLAI